MIKWKRKKKILEKNLGKWLKHKYVVNAVLLNLVQNCISPGTIRPELYQSRYNLSAIMNIKPDTIHMATIQWTINATTTGRTNYINKSANFFMLLFYKLLSLKAYLLKSLWVGMERKHADRALFIFVRWR